MDFNQLLLEVQEDHDSNILTERIYGLVKELRPSYSVHLSPSKEKFVLFRCPNNWMWSLTAGYSLNGGEYQPRLSVEMFGNKDPDAVLTGWDFLRLVGQEKLYNLTFDENVIVQFQVLGAVLEILDGIYPDLKRVPAWY